MSRETHVRFWESAKVRSPRATHLEQYRRPWTAPENCSRELYISAKTLTEESQESLLMQDLQTKSSST